MRDHLDLTRTPDRSLDPTPGSSSCKRFHGNFRVNFSGRRTSRPDQPAEPFVRLNLAWSGADDGIRTRDPNLGKVVLYQLSHVRVPSQDSNRAGAVREEASDDGYDGR